MLPDATAPAVTAASSSMLCARASSCVDNANSWDRRGSERIEYLAELRRRICSADVFVDVKFVDVFVDVEFVDIFVGVIAGFNNFLLHSINCHF